MDEKTKLLHASCVSIAGRGVLLRGASGSGKSDLALRLIMSGPWRGERAPARLVADDQVVLLRRGESVVAQPPPAIKGKLEVRGIGIVDVASVDEAEVRLVVDLVAREEVERLPDSNRAMTLLGIDIPLVSLDAREPSAPIKVLIAFEKLASGNVRSHGVC